MREMIAAFRELGHEVATVINGGEEAAGLHASAIPSSNRQLLKKFLPAIAWETAKDINLQKVDATFKARVQAKINQFNPDLIYERGNYLQTSVVELARELGIPHIIEINAPFVEERARLQGKTLLVGKAREAMRKQLEWPGKVVVVSSDLVNHFSKEYSINSNKFVLTPNAINQGWLEKSCNVASSSKGDDIVIGFVGSILKWHGVELLVDAFLELAAENTQVKLLVVGDGEDLESIRNKAAAAVAPERAQFTGNVAPEKVAAYLEQMDICVMAASNWYGSPVKIFEYGAMGKAIVAPDVGPVRDVMTNGEDGLLIEPTLSALKEALSTFVADAELRQKMGTCFQTKVKEQHTWKKMAEKILNEAAQLL